MTHDACEGRAVNLRLAVYSGLCHFLLVRESLSGQLWPFAMAVHMTLTHVPVTGGDEHFSPLLPAISKTILYSSAVLQGRYWHDVLQEVSRMSVASPSLVSSSP